jgi:hypothetical protein
MSYIKGKVHGYGDWTPSQLNVLILLAHKLVQAEAEGGGDWTGYEPDMVRALDAIEVLLKEVGAANE